MGLLSEVAASQQIRRDCVMHALSIIAVEKRTEQKKTKVAKSVVIRPFSSGFQSRHKSD
jgi:hypothetical protein